MTIVAFIILILGGLNACVTSEIRPEYAASTVLERIGGNVETPKWATGEKVMWADGQEMIFVHTVQMDGDARPDACMKAAGLDAKVELLRYIKESISSSGQMNDVDARADPAYESLTTFLAQGQLNGTVMRERYWEKIEASEVSGERKLKIRCAAMVSIKKSDLERQLRESTNRVPKGDPQIRQALLNAQRSFIESAEDISVDK